MGKRTEAQLKTMNSLKKIGDNIYTLYTQHDYSFEIAKEQSLKSIFDLIGFVQKSLKIKNVKANKKDEFACSAFEATTEDGAHIMGRNFDYMEAPLVVNWTEPKNAYKSLSVCNCTFMLFGKKSIWPIKDKRRARLLMAPYCAMDGINEKGLSIGVLEIKTALTHQKDENKKHTSTTLIIRDCLDYCATVDEAIKEFEKYNMNDAILCNYQYFISDANGDSCVIEYVNNKMVVVREDNLTCCNFFLAEGGDNSKGFGQERHGYIKSVLAEKDGKLSEQEAMKVLDNVHLDYKHDRGYQIITLWSSIYNAKDKSMLISAGLDYSKQYKLYVDKPDYVENIEKENVQTIKDFEGFPHKDKEMV